MSLKTRSRLKNYQVFNWWNDVNQHMTRHDPRQYLLCPMLNTISSGTFDASPFWGVPSTGGDSRDVQRELQGPGVVEHQQNQQEESFKNIGNTKHFCLKVSHVSLIVRRDIHQAVRLRICCATLGRSGGQLGRSFFWWLQQACTKGPARNMCWRFEIISLMSACDFYGDVGSSILAHILLELPTVSYCILCLHASWPFANHVFVGWNCYEFFLHHRSS